ncbi:MAG: hypothetical protein L0Y67_07340 [Gammaproteobacteria bacterium]|nr:hypothetical protein [Gammaproteobacteria bacterium]
MFRILAQLFTVRFSCSEQHGIDTAGEIVVQSTEKAEDLDSPECITSLTVPPPDEAENSGEMVVKNVEFTDDPGVPFPFRGRTLSTKLPKNLAVLSLRANEKVLATSQQGPIWTMSETGRAKHFRSTLPLPQISITQNFSDMFNGTRFLDMLPVLQFLREMDASRVYMSAPLRAGFIIDDPNLHWPRYGFVDYRVVAAHAKAGVYHVSFATIPLDTWYTHEKTAELFQQNSRWLSLLVHGNNHAKKELAGNYPEATRKALLQQAIQRIERLERKANLRICRVMVPPHGACSNKMLAELPQHGFESACISAGSLRAYNQDESWTKTLGFYPSEIIEGCPVLPRWGLTGHTKNTLLLAAYLGQPMILRGHHQDLKDGVEVLDEYARFINGLGIVFWSSMTALSRMNYQWRMEGTTCRVKPFGRNIAFEVPNEATAVIIEKPNPIDDCTWKVALADGSVRQIMTGECLLSPAEVGRVISIERCVEPQPPPVAAGIRSTSAALILRRLLTEVRDRVFVF